MKLNNRLDYRRRRHLRQRKKVHGTGTRPRMSVCVTDRHIYVQFIDDALGVTLAALSTLTNKSEGKSNVAAAQELGKAAAERILEKGITSAVLDRGGNRYAGRVKAIADAARAAGLKI